ncbi:MAG: FHA domain-containing protein [Acidimicrobiales bacterium]
MPNVTVDISAIVASMAAPRLVVVSGPNAGTASALDEGSTTVGRSGDRVDVVVPDPAASRVHLRIDRNGNELRLTDLGSTTGTKVDRVPVDGTVEVTSGSLIEMGSTWLFVDDPMRRVATPGAVVIDLAEAATP